MILNSKMRKFFTLLFLTSLFSACLNKYSDFQVNSNAEFIVPVAHGSFLLGDLLNNLSNDSLFQNNQNNELTFTYRNPELYRFYFTDLFDVSTSQLLADETRSLGLLKLKDTIYYQYIDLQELISRLSFVPEISNIPEGIIESFPGISVDSLVSPFLIWEITDFDYITKAEIEKGVINVYLKNEFPLNCKVTFEFFDSDLIFIDKYCFGCNSDMGLYPNEQESFSIEMAGKFIRAPIFYKITHFQFFSSDTPINIEYAKGFDLKVEVNDLQLNYGIFNAPKFDYSSEVEKANVEMIDSILLSKVVVKSGNLRLNFEKQFETNVTMSLNLPGLMKDNKPFSAEIPLNKQEAVEQNFDLAGMVLNLKTNQNPYNTLEYSFGFTNNTDETIELRASDNYSYSLSIDDLQLSYVEGDFGQRDIDFSKTGWVLNPEIWDLLGPEAFGNNSALTLFFQNNIGMPATCDINIEASNQEGNTVVVETAPFVLPYPFSVNESPANSEKQLNAGNSNIMEFFTLPPNNAINFNLHLFTNPDGEPPTNHPNFVSLNDPFVVGFGLDVPISPNGNAFIYTDTLALNLQKISTLAETATLIFRTKNEIPLQADLTITLFDTLRFEPTSNEFFVTLLDAAPTNESGHATGISEAENRMELTSADLEKVQISNSFLVKVIFKNPDGIPYPIKLDSEHGFDLIILFEVSPKTAPVK